MAQEIISDGTVNWIGGMDTSRSPADISDIQYSKACNVIIPESLGGIRARFGIHHVDLEFENNIISETYRYGQVQGEGYFESNGKVYLICVVNGRILKFTRIRSKAFYVELVNPNDPNSSSIQESWVIQIPNGCIVNNGFDYPYYITENRAIRLDPKKGELSIGRMGVYLQNRLFYVDQSSTRILASDFLAPTKFTLEDTNIFGFACPDDSEKIVAIGKQKSIIGTVEGGNLIWSSNKDIYSVDVRGTRSDWANLGTRLGKVTETVPGFCAVSSNSFESFNTNMFFRSKQYGLAELKQSEYQFVKMDSISGQGVEANYYLQNDTDWMLHRCYTRACNKRLFTTVAPEKNDNGFIYWNGILSYHPAALYSNQSEIPRRFESVFTGVRPWCLTVIQQRSKRDELVIHSYDSDGINRMYVMDEDTDYDINQAGEISEIEGFIETKAYSFKNQFLLKSINQRFYRLGSIERTVSVNIASRPETQGEWVDMWKADHFVGRAKVENGIFIPEANKPQTRPFVYMGEEKFSDCYRLGSKCILLQYRIEFTGPILLEAIIASATYSTFERSVTDKETEQITLVYNNRLDYGYSIAKTEIKEYATPPSSSAKGY